MGISNLSSGSAGDGIRENPALAVTFWHLVSHRYTKYQRMVRIGKKAKPPHESRVHQDGQ